MPGTENLMAGYSNSIGGLMAGHNSMVSGLMANYNAGGGSGGQAMAGQAWALPPGVSYGPGPMNSGGSGGGMPGMFGMESDDPETQRKLLIKRRLKMGKMDGKTPGMPDLPFGGFRAKGGPVRPGFKYLGGEFEEELLTDGKKTQVIGRNGPELFTPTKPAVVIPNAGKKMPSAANPINGLDSYFDGKSRTDFFGGAMKPGKQGRAYDEIRAEANGKAPAADPRSFSHPQGQNFAGPAAPPRSIDAAFSQPAAAPSGGEGRLVASSNGGVKWQAGSGAGFGAPPQSSTPAMRPIDAAFTDPPQLVRSGAKTVNANQGGPLSGRGTAGLQTGSLSMRGATPVGRSANNPQRIAEQMRRRGDPRAIMQMGMQQQGMDFARERDANNFQQQQQRDATNHAQGMQMWNLDRSFQLDAEGRRNQAALDAEGRRNQRGDAEWTRSRDAELEDRKNSAIDAPFTMTDPSGKFVIPGVKTRGGDFKPMGGAYPVKEANAGPTPAEVNQMRQDADTRGYDMVQLPSGEWKLQRKLQPSDQGSETTVYDADGKPTQRTVRTPRGGSAGSKGTGYW